MDCLKDLKDAANCAKGYGNGSLLCDIFCSCVAGVQVILDCLAWSEQFDKLPSLVDATFAVDAEPKLVQLLDTCLICLLAIDIRKTHVQKKHQIGIVVLPQNFSSSSGQSEDEGAVAEDASFGRRWLEPSSSSKPQEPEGLKGDAADVLSARLFQQVPSMDTQE